MNYFQNESVYSEDYNELLYLRARHYVPGTGRFLTRDSWTGDVNIPITYNKWVYANSNPILYTDPSGNSPGLPPDFKESFVRQVENRFGISFTGNWSLNAKFMVSSGVWDVGRKFDTVLAQTSSPGLAFKLVFSKGVNFSYNNNCYGCRPKSCIDENKYTGVSSLGDSCTPEYGVTYSSSQIEFASFYENNFVRGRNNTVHELGHAFDNRLYGIPSGVLSLTKTWIIDCDEYDFPHRTNESYGPYYGFASRIDVRTWQMNSSESPGEEFADTFLGWVYNTWESPNTGSPGGRIRSEWADQWMTGWLNTIVANTPG
jgi:RHS repeat-associated protein